MEHYIAALKKYATFTGRDRRKQFWYFVLFNFLISIGVGIIDGILGGITQGALGGFLGPIYSLALIVPGLAAGARRLHDTGRSGWWQLIGLVPLVGVIVLIVFLAGGTEPGTNQYDT